MLRKQYATLCQNPGILESSTSHAHPLWYTLSIYYIQVSKKFCELKGDIEKAQEIRPEMSQRHTA